MWQQNKEARDEKFKNLNLTLLHRCRDDKEIDFSKCKDFLDKNGNLRTSHTYYTQVQLMAWISGAKFIDLCLYTTHDCKIVPVELDIDEV